MTLDGKILDSEGGSDWVDSWADGLELLPPVDSFVLGAGMFSGYQEFWAAMLDDHAAVSEMLGRDPYPRELAYAQVASTTEHLVLSTTLADVTWPSARIVRSLDAIRAFKQQGNGTTYVVGGPTLHDAARLPATRGALPRRRIQRRRNSRSQVVPKPGARSKRYGRGRCRALPRHGQDPRRRRA